MSTKMPRMIYTKAPHIKNRNAVGFVVKCAAQPDMPFFKLPEALEYCETMGLPDDADHLILDPANARLLAVPLLHHGLYKRKQLSVLPHLTQNHLVLSFRQLYKFQEEDPQSVPFHLYQL